VNVSKITKFVFIFYLDAKNVFEFDKKNNPSGNERVSMLRIMLNSYAFLRRELYRMKNI